MSSIKIFNDPVYGFITVPRGIILNLIEHPYFQRLQRIKQLGLSHYIYPGAVHSRFHHALGAYHLMTSALHNLRLKGVPISKEEFEAAQIAILLHDIGHGPFSHVLEHTIVPVPHEEMTVMMMEELNLEFDGALDLAIKLFRNEYSRPFLQQLISSQLDMDRLDYLNRDSFFTGVAEGVIGYDRLILMMDVVDNQLVIEEKAIFSIEKFLTSRKIMYLQVYMHKTALAAESMLILFLDLVRKSTDKPFVSPALNYFLENSAFDTTIQGRKKLIENYTNIDDVDIWFLLKTCLNSKFSNIQNLAKGLINRRLFKIRIQDGPLENHPLETGADSKDFLSSNNLALQTRQDSFEFIPYNQHDGEILIKTKEGELVPFSNIPNMQHLQTSVKKYFMIMPQF
ncbi:MAG: HD domain-containing protein [Saprospiraceae bacterium]|nr:HD domain-containing protein [Candidatus Vicinibacter affinis]MBP6173447.1 HD domain-containing protein [Saprospiraceae bacterium]MBK6570939.1 HD domain-containing protein [Candidatus Vicinibacter affinis]MBK7303318.1 HD domain-containing protein [Candidatus Vicinibacter affinis]MBK7799909.1 HD domain-containing protein [Candidatus Vicinibacter affinis]